VASRSERVLVTGARGFTGRHLCERLRAEGYDVVGLVESPPVGADEARANLLDAAAMASAVVQARPDRVIHLAAVSFVAHDDVEAIYRTNVLGSLALLRTLAARAGRVRSVILASSANVYGNVEHPVIDETVPPEPVSHYAASKLAMEHMAATFRNDLPIVIARPFNYTGPGQAEHFVVPKIISHFRRRASAVELGNIDVVREFLDVRAVVDVYCRLLECPAAVGETVNICTGRGIALREVIAALEAETSHHMDIRVNAQFVRANEVRRLVGSPRKLEALIGTVAEIPLTKTLRDMLTSC
jgi:nucleoside-diphosphate-sugar epimerase